MKRYFLWSLALLFFSLPAFASKGESDDLEATRKAVLHAQRFVQVVMEAERKLLEVYAARISHTISTKRPLTSLIALFESGHNHINENCSAPSGNPYHHYLHESALGFELGKSPLSHTRNMFIQFSALLAHGIAIKGAPEDEELRKSFIRLYQALQSKPEKETLFPNTLAAANALRVDCGFPLIPIPKKASSPTGHYQSEQEKMRAALEHARMQLEELDQERGSPPLYSSFLSALHHIEAHQAKPSRPTSLWCKIFCCRSRR